MNADKSGLIVPSWQRCVPVSITSPSLEKSNGAACFLENGENCNAGFPRANKSLIGVYRRSSVALFCLGLAVGVYAQTLRIPDFRQPEAGVALRPGEACLRCGVIRSIREVRVSRPVNVPSEFRTDPIDRGPGSNIYVGAVVALPIADAGEQPGKPFVGGVGTPEMRERFSETTYEITIRLDEGGFTQVTRRDGGSYRVGDRVRVSGTQLELIAP